MLFAQFEDSVQRLEKLTDVYLDYPVNAMTAVCKLLKMPKKTSLEAVSMFEMACGNGQATASRRFYGDAGDHVPPQNPARPGEQNAAA
jgi:hypothetical protein